MSSEEDLPDKLKHLEIVASKLVLQAGNGKKEAAEEPPKREHDLTANPFFAHPEFPKEEAAETPAATQIFSHCRKCRMRRRSEGEAHTECSDGTPRSDVPGVLRQTFKRNSKTILRDPVLRPIRKSFPGGCPRRHMPLSTAALIETFRSASQPGSDTILAPETCFDQSKSLKQQQQQQQQTRQEALAAFQPDQVELRNGDAANVCANAEGFPANCSSITAPAQMLPEQSTITPRSSTSCAQQAGGTAAPGGGGGTSDDVTIDELASYFDTLVHIPKKMSSMAEMMYT